MQLILVRHGEANPVDGVHITSDSTRTLTERGKLQAEKTAQAICLKYQPDLLIVSPYSRAKQTMQAFERQLLTTATVYEGITPLDDDKKALDYLSAQAESANADCVLVVCHMDIVARLCARATNDPFVSFALAEARVLEQTIIADGLSRLTDSFSPNI